MRAKRIRKHKMTEAEYLATEFSDAELDALPDARERSLDAALV
jgi:hypothetical protein